MKQQRKVMIFFLCLVSGIVASIFMPEGHYKIFMDGIIWLAAGFFAGNAFEHFSSAFRARKGPGNMNDDQGVAG
jgi:hypothetical protein